jgi:hypothetical protein
VPPDSEAPVEGASPEEPPKSPPALTGKYAHTAKPLKEWLKDYPDLLEDLRRQYRESPEWQGIDPDKTPVFYRTQDEVRAIRNKSGERGGGHHPHHLSLGGPEGQTFTHTGDIRGQKTNDRHREANKLQNRIIDIIKNQL